MNSKKKTIPLNQYLADVSTLSYGCMGLGGGWNQNPVSRENINQAHQVVDTALQAGINLFDHADIYTMGKAEKVFGQVLTESPGLREKMYIQSKCAIRPADDSGPTRYDFSRQWVSSSVDNILTRLNSEYIDILLLHRPDPLMELDEIAETLYQLKNSGKVHHFGVSNMHQHQIAFLQSALDAPIVTNQIEISLDKLGWLEEGIMAGNPEGRDINFSAGTLEYCRLNNVQIQAWGSLARGLFSGRDTTGASAAVKGTSLLVSKLADKYQAPCEAVVLAWLMRHPARVQPVIGTTNLDRIKACCQAELVNLTREEWYSLYESARGQALP
ncbi:aldo/keto reductase [Psychromonas ossibalaenae]|uniref:aldo/keto reductase n=1 Tax=Psychromonas ossibalaenae TaxID=444922 RepID=UPI000362167F|nr:aldo/keto reductase [Psychromonas ossibalaenae]